jgi:hypothetical protein
MPLFDLPEYDQAFGEFFFLAINELMRLKSPLLNQIPSVKVDHLPISRNSFDNGTVVDNQPFPIEASLTAPIADCISNNVDVVASIIDDAAEQAVKIVVPQILGAVGKLSQAAGTRVDAQGRQLSHDLITEALAAIEIDFDEAGNAKLPTLVAGPALIEALTKLPPPTEEQIARQNAVIEEKRKAFNARQRHRKLH